MGADKAPSGKADGCEESGTVETVGGGGGGCQCCVPCWYSRLQLTDEAHEEVRPESVEKALHSFQVGRLAVRSSTFDAELSIVSLGPVLCGIVDRTAPNSPNAKRRTKSSP